MATISQLLDIAPLHLSTSPIKETVTFTEFASKYARASFLFTYSELKSFVLPATLFGLFTSFADLFGRQTPLDPLNIILRVPLISLWVWFQILAFDIDNQKSPKAIAEDRLNKPWRPLPANVLTIEEAQWFSAIAYPIAMLVGFCLGAWKQSVLLFIAGYYHNNMGGSERMIERNLLNVVGYLCYNMGAVKVANAGFDYSYGPKYVPWVLLLGAVVFTSVHMQDFRDEEGDAFCGRATVPLVLGDHPARVLTSVTIIGWSLIAPAFWGLGVLGFTMPSLLGAYIAGRLLLDKSVKSDELLWVLWGFWLIVLYTLPLMPSVTMG